MSSDPPPEGPPELKLPQGEGKYYDERRIRAEGIYRELGKDALPLPARPTALSLSGGGIRSATLSLGVLAALSEKELVHKFDFLSTVSGGGYTGGFYGSLFVRPRERGAEETGWEDPADSLDPLGTPFGRAAIRHLRDNGRYLLDGAGDAVRLMVIAIRGWIAIQLVIGVTLLAGFLVAKTVQAWLANAHFVAAFEVNQYEGGWPSFLWVEEWLRGFPLGEVIVLSWLWPFAVAFLGIAVTAGWAFWLTRLSSVPDSRIHRLWSGGFVGTLLIAAACLYAPVIIGDACSHRDPAGWCRIFSPAAPRLYYASVIIGCLALGAMIFYAWAEFWHGAAAKADDSVSPDVKAAADTAIAQEGRVRSTLTGYASWWLAFAFITAVLAIIDSTAQTFYRLWLWDNHSGVALPLTGGALVAAFTPFVRSVIEWAQTSGPAGPRLRRYGRLIALVMAMGLVLMLGIFWAMLAEYIAWRGGPIGGGVMPIVDPNAVPWSLASVWVPALCFTGIALAIGLSPGFLNLSTFGAFYAARLRRAYLGASNPMRAQDYGGREIEIDDPGDDILPHVYFNPTTGAPLHIINVTLNETTGRNGSALVQRDRKGLPLTVSPAGFLVSGEKIS